MKVTAIGNRKGGVGKASVIVGLATGLRVIWKKVLVADLAPHANATDAMEGAGEFNVFDVLYAGEAVTLGQAMTSTTYGGTERLRPLHY